MKKLFALLLSALLLLSLLSGCGSASSDSSYAYSGSSKASLNEYSMTTTESAAWDMDSADYEVYAEEAAVEDAVSTSSEDLPETQTASSAEKIIYTASVSMETTEFDKALASLENTVSSCGGYIESSNVYGYTQYNSDGTSTVVDRYASYTVAVPSASFEAVLSSAGSIGNVTNKSRNAQNVTSQYTDIEARLESLQVQEERILDLMKQAEDIEDLITLESRLSEITYELESYQRQLNNYDRRISYSTITFYIQEVEVYTPVVSTTRTFGQKAADALSDGWNSFVRGLQDFVLWFVEALPTLVLLAVIVTGVIFLIRGLRSRKERRERRAEEAAAKAGTSQEEK